MYVILFYSEPRVLVLNVWYLKLFFLSNLWLKKTWYMQIWARNIIISYKIYCLQLCTPVCCYLSQCRKSSNQYVAQEYSLTLTWNLIHHVTQFLSEITLNQQITYANIYPFPIRNLGAVVAVRKCSPSGDQWSNVVSAASILAISFRAIVSHNSTLPWTLPNPPRIKSDGS